MTPAPASPSRRRVAGSSLLLIATEGATRATSFVAIAYLSRTLAPAGMGAVEFGFAVFGLVHVLGTGGVDALLTPAAARCPDDVPRLAGRGLLLAWSQFAAVVTLLLAGATLFEVAPELRASAPWFVAAAVLMPAGMRFAFVAGERAWVSGTTHVLGAVVFAALCFVMVRTPADATAVGLAWLVATAVRTAVAHALFRRRHGPVELVTEAWLAWLRRAATVGLGSIAASLMLNADVVVLGLLRAPEEVAAYGLATKVPLFLSSLAMLVYTALFPTLVRAVAERATARLGRIADEGVVLALAFGVPGAVALGLAAEPLVTLLFSARFRAAAPILAVFAWRVPLAAASGIFQGMVWATSPEREARIGVTVCLATLLPMPLAAMAWGPLGVATCIVLGQGLALVLYARSANVLGSVSRSTLVRTVAGAAMTATLWHLMVPADGLVAVLWMLVAWTLGSVLALLPRLPRLLRA